MESSPTVRGLQAVLRRAKFLAPGLRTVSALGVDPALLGEAAAREGLTLADGPGDLEIVWSPGTTAGPSSGRSAVAVIAPAVDTPPLPHLASDMPARTYVSLRAWVEGWFEPSSPARRLLAPILVSPAVGDRPTRVLLAGNRERIYLASPAPSSGSHGEGWKTALVSGFGCGFFPLMPATLACAVLVPVAVILQAVAGWSGLFLAALATAAVSTAASVALEKWAARRLLAEDPREFVLDEFAGMAVTWMFLPPGAPWWGVVLGFLLFRVFDIFKWGVDWVEKLPVPGKIVWDDVLAGIYAGVVLLAVMWVV